MKQLKHILVISYAYCPGIGGIELTSKHLKCYWESCGIKVSVITHTLGDGLDQQVYCRPRLLEEYKLVREADIVWYNNPTFTYWIALLFFPEKTICTYQTWFLEPESKKNKWLFKLKIKLLRRIKNIAISKAVQDALSLSSEIIPNPVDPVFSEPIKPSLVKKDLLFVGRLVSDKGLDLLICALAELKQKGECLSLTVVGKGPEKNLLKKQIKNLGIEKQVTFEGVVQGSALKEIYAQHRILVVPSRWKEPQGIVAMEGLVSGCLVIVPDQGGLFEFTEWGAKAFAHGSVDSLVNVLEQMSEIRESESRPYPWSVNDVGGNYLKHFNQLLEGNN